MKKISEPILFFGSGPVASQSLELLNKHFNVEAVITKPRPAHHKGDTPVVEIAEKLQLPVLTAADKAAVDALFETTRFLSRLAILIDFGVIIPQQTIDFFPLGIVNSHFSLLPEWRGADPITFSILSGQARTGVSLMLLTAGLDEGPLLAQAECTIDAKATTPDLTAHLIELSDALIKNVVPEYINGETTPVDQLAATISHTKTPTYSRRLTKEDGKLDFRKSAVDLEREIRAFIEWPKSTTMFGETSVIITAAHVLDAAGAPGARSIVDGLPVIFCNTGALAIEKLKPAGKQEMTGSAFLAGYKKIFVD